MLSLIYDINLIPEGTPYTTCQASKTFDVNFDLEDLMDPFCKKIIKEIDKSEVIGPNLIQSPVLGPIPPSQLSGGSKALMLTYKTNIIVSTANMGNNCADLLFELSNIKDILIIDNSEFIIPEKAFYKSKVAIVDKKKVYTDFYTFMQDVYALRSKLWEGFSYEL